MRHLHFYSLVHNVLSWLLHFWSQLPLVVTLKVMSRLPLAAVQTDQRPVELLIAEPAVFIVAERLQFEVLP